MIPQPRDVIRIWDRQTRPPKPKLSICVDPDLQWFLRINTRPLFKPHHFLAARGTDYLDHDSYVELQQLVRHFAIDIQQAERVGRMNDTDAHRLCLSVQASVTLSQEHKDLICDRLGFPNAGKAD